MTPSPGTKAIRPWKRRRQQYRTPAARDPSGMIAGPAGPDRVFLPLDLLSWPHTSSRLHRPFPVIPLDAILIPMVHRAVKMSQVNLTAQPYRRFRVGSVNSITHRIGSVRTQWLPPDAADVSGRRAVRMATHWQMLMEYSEYAAIAGDEICWSRRTPGRRIIKGSCGSSAAIWQGLWRGQLRNNHRLGR